MIWASWRLQRLQLITLLGLVVAGAGAVFLVRSAMIDDLAAAGLTQCVTQALNDCAAPGGTVKAFGQKWHNPLDIGRMAVFCAPALVGVFVGAPLFARELEQGTHVLAFTQSVSRTRWMFSKLAIALVPALAALVALQWLVSWWLGAAGTLGPRMNGAFNPINFGIDHVSPAAYALFAFALGTFLGVLTRRTLVAMTAGLGVYVVARFAFSGVVDRLVTPQRVEVTPDKQLSMYDDRSLVLTEGWLDAARQPVPAERVQTVVQACKDAPGDSQEAFLQCLPQSGLATKYATFIPQSQAWQVHLADLAVFGVLAVVLLAGTTWALRRQS
ncbi:ABC transporter permease subunit [Lentzea sp. NPDC059081]|uniref:ABC transporter permease subunit n=1 Tax=Lentzea sp. NPDC059081 TaxID=3346719 RepID=UPI0036B70972